ncbi:hypothetical protein SAMN05421874_109140 [Nonomuraea maritima]|uniref:Subtilisin inhibitor-like n=1 Tax=Nonomuraea maritima TaxID=683260 RepID=A0A1G9DH65_9ACTN|nr:hypothetical protein [Nonomuraea maritima]SDK63206.1 hypothetical protein SAMN05421874_109140 [Nonomuraea maritima]
MFTRSVTALALAMTVAAGFSTDARAVPHDRAEFACGKAPKGARVTVHMTHPSLAHNRAAACTVAMDVADAYARNAPAPQGDLPYFLVQVGGTGWSCSRVEQATVPHGECVHPPGDKVKVYD